MPAVARSPEANKTKTQHSTIRCGAVLKQNVTEIQKVRKYLNACLYGGGTGVCVFLHIFDFLLLPFNFSVKSLHIQRKYILVFHVISDQNQNLPGGKVSTCLLFVEVIHESLDVTELCHLQGVLALPGIVHPIFQGSAALLIMIQLLLLLLQVPQSGQEGVGVIGKHERITNG